MNLNSLNDVIATISVDINKIKMPLNKILKLEKGSIIDFNIPAGELSNIRINNHLIGKGEIIVFEKNLAIRINDILTLENTNNISNISQINNAFDLL